MRSNMKYRAFTLIELLITASILVVITTLTTATFAGIGRNQNDRRTKAAGTALLDQIATTMNVDMAQSTPSITSNPSIVVLPNGGVNILAIRRYQNRLNPSGPQAWHIYCLDQVSGQLLRFRALYTGAASTFNTGTGQVACTQAGVTARISGVFSTQSDILTNTSTAAGTTFSAQNTEFLPIYGGNVSDDVTSVQWRQRLTVTAGSESQFVSYRTVLVKTGSAANTTPAPTTGTTTSTTATTTSTTGSTTSTGTTTATTTSATTRSTTGSTTVSPTLNGFTTGPLPGIE